MIEKTTYVNSAKEAFDLEISKIILSKREDVLNIVRTLVMKANAGNDLFDDFVYKLDSLLDMNKYLFLSKNSEKTLIEDFNKEKNELEIEENKQIVTKDEGFDLHELD